MKIFAIKDLQSGQLKNYIESRGIDFSNTKFYCKEVLVEINQRQYSLIGLKNDSGGYELRGMNDFKSTVPPKSFSFIQNDDELETTAVAVVEGMFDFLSLLEKQDDLLPELSNFLVLNSLSFFEKATAIMEEHERVYLLLDNDASGKAFAASALKRSMKYTDLSYKYSEHKDLNHWLVKEKNHERLERQQQMQRPIRDEHREEEQVRPRGFRR